MANYLSKIAYQQRPETCHWFTICHTFSFLNQHFSSPVPINIILSYLTETNIIYYLQQKYIAIKKI